MASMGKHITERRPGRCGVGCIKIGHNNYIGYSMHRSAYPKPPSPVGTEKHHRQVALVSLCARPWFCFGAEFLLRLLGTSDDVVLHVQKKQNIKAKVN